MEAYKPNAGNNPFLIMEVLKTKMEELGRAVKAVYTQPNRVNLGAAETALSMVKRMISALQEFEVAYRAN